MRCGTFNFHMSTILPDDDWGAPNEENDYLPEVETAASSLTLPRLPRSPERLPNQVNRGVSPSCNRNRRAAEFRQRSPSPQYQPRVNPSEVTSPRERFHDAKEMFRAMEREAIARPVLSRQRDLEHHPVHRCLLGCLSYRVDDCRWSSVINVHEDVLVEDLSTLSSVP